MKKKSLLLFLLILMSFNTLHAQIVKGYGALGTNLAQVDGDEAYGFYKFGLNVGLGAEVQFSELFSGSIEANFNQKGARKYMFYYGYNLRINYAEVPIMFHVTDNNKVKFGIGASYSRPVGTVYENDPRDGYGKDEYGNLYSFFSIKDKTDEMTTYKQFRDANDGMYDTGYFEPMMHYMNASEYCDYVSQECMPGASGMTFFSCTFSKKSSASVAFSAPEIVGSRCCVRPRVKITASKSASISANVSCETLTPILNSTPTASMRAISWVKI